MSKLKTGLTLKNLMKATGVPPYTIKYLYSCNRLPVMKESRGSGYPIIFDPLAIEVLLEHKLKRSYLSNNNPRIINEK